MKRACGGGGSCPYSGHSTDHAVCCTCTTVASIEVRDVRVISSSTTSACNTRLQSQHWSALVRIPDGLSALFFLRAAMPPPWMRSHPIVSSMADGDTRLSVASCEADVSGRQSHNSQPDTLRRVLTLIALAVQSRLFAVTWVGRRYLRRIVVHCNVGGVVPCAV